MDVQKTGRLIAQARKERGLTQRELAKRLHVSDRAVSKWERGLNLPEAALFEPLCQALGITVTELLRGERAEASVPVLEQAVDEAVALAGAQERGKKRYWRVILVLLALLAAAGVLIGRPMWEDYYQRQRYYAQDNVVPRVCIAFRGARTNGEFYPLQGGHHAPLNSDCSMSYADLRIWFPPESTTIRIIPCIRPEELEVARAILGLSFDKPGLEVEMVRWPESAVGTQVTLEEAERVELLELETDSVWRPEGWRPGSNPVAYKFELEAGYFYSVVLRWGEGWYLEYPFRAIK